MPTYNANRLRSEPWCHYLEDYPMYANRKAAKWTVVSCSKLPSVAEFIKDVKLAIDANLLERKRLVARLIA